MDNYNNSFIDLLNSSPPNNDNTPNPTNPQNPPQNPNFPPYPNYPPHPHFPQYGNYPPPPNYPPNPNYPQYPNYPPPNPNYPQYPQYPQFPQPPNAPVRPNSAPLVEDEDEGPADTMGRRKWTPKEEEVLVGAFLTASEDPVVGNDQKADTFWRRVVTYFNQNCGSSHRRGLKQCKNKYHAMMGKVTLFSGLYNKHASHWQSGASDEQILADARAEYKRGNNNKPFPFEHVWQMVRESPKWKTQAGFEDSYQPRRRTRVNEAGDYTSSDCPETPAASQAESTDEFPTQPLDEDEPSHDPPPSVERRPIGQKAAKRKGKGKVGGSSQPEDNISQFYERLQLSISEHAEAIRQKNELERERNEVNRQMAEVLKQKARDKAMFQLMKLEDKDTSNMTPAVLEKHMARIAYIREQYGFD